jgi:hypothetical protein
VAHGNAVIDTLRNARGAQDEVLVKLKADSLEARRERIARVVESKNWVAGPAELVATFERHALVSKDGAQLRVRVTEAADGSIVLDKVEVFALAQPAPDVVSEVFETAKAAVDKILEGDFAGATPMVAAVANVVYTSGDLHRRISTEVAKRSINRSAWWHQIVREHMEKVGPVEEIQIPAPNTPEALLQAVDSLKSTLIDEARLAAQAVGQLAENKAIPASIVESAKEIVADLKYAIQALSNIASTNIEETTGIYEGVGAVANQLRLGARFLASLSGNK